MSNPIICFIQDLSERAAFLAKHHRYEAIRHARNGTEPDQNMFGFHASESKHYAHEAAIRHAQQAHMRERVE